MICGHKVTGYPSFLVCHTLFYPSKDDDLYTEDFDCL